MTDDELEQASGILYCSTRKHFTNNESRGGQTCYEEWESDDRNEMG